MKHPLHRNSELLTPLAIFLGSIIIAGAIVGGARNLGGGRAVSYEQAGAPGIVRQDAQQKAAIVDSSKIRTNGEPAIGLASAPVTVAYWYDYQCPFCKKIEEDSIVRIFDEYVKTGKVRLVFKDFQFLGNDSRKLGLMAQAVWEIAPAKFYDWNKAVFASQGRENSGWATDAGIITMSAPILGQELTKKALDLTITKAEAYGAALDADKTEAGTFGVRSTPSLVIGKQLIVGAQPYEQIKAAIESALKAK